MVPEQTFLGLQQCFVMFPNFRCSRGKTSGMGDANDVMATCTELLAPQCSGPLQPHRGRVPSEAKENLGAKGKFLSPETYILSADQEHFSWQLICSDTAFLPLRAVPQLAGGGKGSLLSCNRIKISSGKS